MFASYQKTIQRAHLLVPSDRPGVLKREIKQDLNFFTLHRTSSISVCMCDELQHHEGLRTRLQGTFIVIFLGFTALCAVSIL